MIVKKVTQAGNSIIRKRSDLIKNISSKSAKSLVKNLIDSMRFYSLVGMAAPQIGVNLRVFVTEVRKTKYRKGVKDSDSLRVYINPEIIQYSKEEDTSYEGCGSVASAQIFAPVKRSVEILVRAKDEKGNAFKLKANGLLARVIQHEIDHLDGIVFTDKISDVKKIKSREEYLK